MARGKRPAKLRNSVPTANLRVLLEIVRDRGVAPERLVAGSAVTLAMLGDPELRVPAREAARLIANAYALTGDPGLGLEFGLRAKPTTHGYLGYAAMACGTLKEALQLLVRFLRVRQRDVSLSLYTDAQCIVLQGIDTHDIGFARRFIYEAMMVGFWRMSGFLLGEERIEGELWFDWPEPAYFSAYRQRLPTTRFCRSSVQARFPIAYVDRPLVMAEPEAAKRAVAECERELALAGAGPLDLRARVLAELKPGENGYPDLEAIAARLFMSGRTLKRRLQQCGMSFLELLDEVRYRDAQRLLGNPDLDIQAIAGALGYSDPPSFTRAFRRWSGKTPTQARTGSTART